MNKQLMNKHYLRLLDDIDNEFLDPEYWTVESVQKEFKTMAALSLSFETASNILTGLREYKELTREEQRAL